MAGGRCEAAGCGRFVRAGERRCRVHGGGLAAVEPAGEEAAGAAFRRRLMAGAYRELYGSALAAVLAEAAAERGLADEIGALRVTLARLLVEETDASRLATAVARVAGVAVQAAREQRAITGEGGDGWDAVVAQVLAELDGEGGSDGGDRGSGGGAA